MATTRNVNQISATGKQVAANVARLRGGMQYKELSEKLAEVGRPITPMGLKRLESGERKVDVDDLMALAIVFDVSPLTLLLPESGSREITAEVTGYPHALGSNVLWEWARGDAPIELKSSGLKKAVAMFRGRARPSVIDKRLVEENGSLQTQVRIEHFSRAWESFLNGLKRLQENGTTSVEGIQAVADELSGEELSELREDIKALNRAAESQGMNPLFPTD